MDDIRFPSWVSHSPAFAFARVLGYQLRRQPLDTPATDNSPQALALGSGGPRWGDAPLAVSGREELLGPCMQEGYSGADVLFGRSRTDPWLASLSSVSMPQHLHGGAMPTTHAFSVVNSGYMLLHPRVTQLFEMSQAKDLIAGQGRISGKNAPVLIALVALAVECRSLPLDRTKSFYLECVSLYTSLMQQLNTTTFSLGVDIRGFVSSLVACGIHLRHASSGSGGLEREKAGCTTSTCAGKDVGDGSVELSREGLVGFGAHVVDPLLVQCIPSNADECVDNSIALGALEGIAIAGEAGNVDLGTELVEHLHNLTDALVTSSHRRDPPYKELLCYLVEALSSVHGVCYTKLRYWCLTLLRPEYILRGLQRREGIQARLVAATLRLLMGWLKETAMSISCPGDSAARSGGNGDGGTTSCCSISNFVDRREVVEAETLIEGVWAVLQDSEDKWGKVQNRSFVLYGTSLRAVVVSLLQAELERIRCYAIVNSTCQHNAHSGQQRERGNGSGDAGYVPSMEEDALRLGVIGNIVKFLLLPKSAFAAIGTAGPVVSLHQDIAEHSAKVLAFVASTDGRALSTSTHPFSVLGAKMRRIQFSNKFYGGVEQVTHELIRCILRAGNLGIATSSNVETRSRTAALCLQGLCATNAYIRALVSTEVNDAVTRNDGLQQLGDGADEAGSNVEGRLDQGPVDVSLRFSVCFEMMNRVLLSRHHSLCNPLPYESLRRYTQLLFDTVEDTLRAHTRCIELSHTNKQFPGNELQVTADAFWHLTRRCHDRVLAMVREALRDLPHNASGDAGDEWNKSPLVEAINNEGKVLRLLLHSVLRCMINCLWPGSGIIYDTNIDGGKETQNGHHMRSDMSEVALATLSLFLQPLCLLCQLLTLLPEKDVQCLKSYRDNVQRFKQLESTDSFMHHSGIQPNSMSLPLYDDSDAAQLRSYWLMLTYYGFTSKVMLLTQAEGKGAEGSPDVKQPRGGEYVLSWNQTKGVRLLASLSPQLLRMRSTDYQQVMSDIELLERHLRNYSTDSHAIKPYRKGLLQYLEDCCPGVSSVGRRLPFSELFLFHALATLEILRASCGFISTIAQYHRFEICEFDASADFRAATSCLTAAATNRYLSALKATSPDTAAKRIEADVPQLVLLYGFAVQSVRRSAKEILSKIISAFPSFVGTCQALPLLWDVIGVLEKGSAAEVELYCQSKQMLEPPAVAADPESPERRKQLSEAVSFAVHWAQLAEQGSPIALREHAERFIVEQPTYGTVEPGIGLSLALRAHNAGGLSATSKPMCERSLIRRSNAKGHVRALFRVATHGGADQLLLQHLQEAGEDLVKTFGLSKQLREQQFVTLTNALSGEIGVDDFSRGCHGGEAEDTAHRGSWTSTCTPPCSQTLSDKLHESDTLACSAAVLLTSARLGTSMHISLLQCIVQYPIRSFSSDALAKAISCWRWILFERPGLFAAPLLAEVVEGFVWTITHRVGLFDGSRPRGLDEVESGRKPQLRRDAAIYSHDYATNSPHKLLAEFLIACYVDEGGPVSFVPPVLHLLKQLALRIVKTPSRLSTKDTSFSEMTRCVLMIGLICRNLQAANECRAREGLPALTPAFSVGALRQGFYRCLMHWFQKTPPSWYFSRDRTAAEKELAALQKLMEMLDRDMQALSRSSDGFLDFASPEKSADSTLVNLTLVGSVSQRRIGEDIAGGTFTDIESLIAAERERLMSLIRLLQLLVKHEHHRLLVWLHPSDSLSTPSRDYFDAISSGEWLSHCTAASESDPAVLVALVARFPNKHVVGWAAQIVSENPEVYCNIPGAVDLYLNSVTLVNGYPALHLFRNGGLVQSLRHLHARYATRYPQVSAYALRSLLCTKCDSLTFYLPQILQILSEDPIGAVPSFLKKMCKRSQTFEHQLLWSLQAEGGGDSEHARKCSQLASEIRHSFNASRKAFHDGEFHFIDRIISLSGEMMPVERPLRKGRLRLRLRDKEFHGSIGGQHLYLPTDPNWRIVALRPDTAGAMQSAAKCPIMVEFHCVPQNCRDGENAQGEATGSDKEAVTSKLCIFKMGDDCRQDQLALQLIGLFRRVFDSIQLPSFLYPYKVVATGRDCGVIECVPRAMSRDQIGKLVEGNLSEYFVQTYGYPESVRFHRARECFIRSMASYATASFVLNIKDRHNGNILIDSYGHLVHIDFGFLFDLSPGGDINFESSPFKLTLEMAQLMGYPVNEGKGKQPSPSLAKALVDLESYNLFVDLTIRCFLAVRQYAHEICVLVELMLSSGLPCFKPKKTIHDLSWRLAMHKSEAWAADFMRKRIAESRENVRTVLYDRYQNYAEGIEM